MACSQGQRLSGLRALCLCRVISANDIEFLECRLDLPPDGKRQPVGPAVARSVNLTVFVDGDHRITSTDNPAPANVRCWVKGGGSARKVDVPLSA